MGFDFSWSVFADWPVPKYLNPVKRGPETYIISSIFLSLVTVAVALRLYARIWVRKWFGLDDLCIVLAYLSAVGVSTTVYIGVAHYGWDRHLWDVKPNLLNGSALVFYVACLCWAFAATLVRLSLLCFYYRLTEHVRIKRYIWILHAVVTFTIVFFFVYLFCVVFFCIPPHDFWDHPLEWPVLKCSNAATIVFTMSIVNTALELVVAVLPIPVIFSVRMDRRQQWSIISLLCLGLLVTILGIVRCWFVWTALIATNDATWGAEPHWIVSEVENNVAIICACAPALRPLLGRMFNESPMTLPTRESEGSLTPLGPLPTWKPKHYLEWQNARGVGYFDLEGIANDGLGYTYCIIAGSESDATERRSTLEPKPPKNPFLRMRRWLRRRKPQTQGAGAETKQNETNIDPNQLEAMDHIEERKEVKIESSLRPEYGGPSSGRESPWMDLHSGRFSPSPPPPDQSTVEYLTWTKVTDPSKRTSITQGDSARQSVSQSPPPAANNPI